MNFVEGKLKKSHAGSRWIWKLPTAERSDNVSASLLIVEAVDVALLNDFAYFIAPLTPSNFVKPSTVENLALTLGTTSIPVNACSFKMLRR